MIPSLWVLSFFYDPCFSDREHSEKDQDHVVYFESISKSTRKDLFVYCESMKRELKRRLIYEYRCDERLKNKNEESTRLTDTGLVVELEHLKTKTRLIDEKFARVRGECET
jgi:hypothetical protein